MPPKIGASQIDAPAGHSARPREARLKSGIADYEVITTMIKLIYSRAQFASKPKDKGVIVGLQKPTNYVFSELNSVDDVARLIGEGRAWRAGLYENGIDSFKKANVKAAQVIAMDFDCCDYEPQAVIDYATSIGISPSAWYYSYSQGIKAGYNFRILWILEEPIKAIQYETIYKTMLEQFSQYKPDGSTKDASRLWFGGNSGVNVLIHTPMPLSAIGWLGVVEKVKQGQAIQKARKAVKGCENKFFEDAQENDIEPLCITQGWKWWEQLRGSKCWLWNRWENGIYLNYNQRLTLFTNLKYLKYADNNLSVVKDVLQFFYKYQHIYAGHTCNEEQIRSMFLNTTLHAIGIVNDGESENPITVKEYLSRSPHTVENTMEKISIEELDRQLTEKMPVLLGEEGINYIVSQTASGKTYYVIQWVLQQNLKQKKIIYAAPTYALIDEFVERFTAAYEERQKTKIVKTDIDDVLKVIPRGIYEAEDYLLMELGLPARTRQVNRRQAIQEMLNIDNKGLFVCTHQCIAHLRECMADYIIIDENIEKALINYVEIDEIALSGLLSCVENTEKQKMVLSVINDLKSGERGEIIDIGPLKQAMVNFDWDKYIASDNKVAGVGKILDYSPVPPTIGLIKKQIKGKKVELKEIRLPTKSTLIDTAYKHHIPIKILTATPLSELIKTVYGEDVIKVYSFPLAQNKGTIIQYTGISGAKGNDLEHIDEIIKYVKSKLTEEEIRDSYVLSFRDAADKWKEAGFNIQYIKNVKGEDVPLHLANNAGLDLLKGKSIIVAGKFDNNDDYYLNKYYEVFPDSTEIPKRVKQTITIANRIRTLYLYDDETLRKIQIETIRLYLQQSVGRARALREAGAKVYLFANFPIEDADKYIDD